MGKAKTNDRQVTDTTSHRGRHGGRAAEIDEGEAKAPAGGPGKSLVLVTKVLAGQPAIDDAIRAAFRAQTSDARCDVLGAQTRAPAVLADAAAWAPTLGTYAAKKLAELNYSPKRVAWYCECVIALADEIAAARGARGGNTALASSAQAARIAARGSHRALASKLVRLAGDDPAQREVVSGARAPNRTDDELTTAIEALAKLADGWLSRAAMSPGAAAVCEDAGLDAALVAEVRVSAATLVTVGAAKTEAGAAIVKDTPEVNRVEGRVLAEMRLAYRAFSDAHAADNTVPRLTPGPGTRRVVAIVDRGDEEDATDPTDPAATDPTAGTSPGPGSPAAQPAPAPVATTARRRKKTTRARR